MYELLYLKIFIFVTLVFSMCLQIIGIYSFLKKCRFFLYLSGVGSSSDEEKSVANNPALRWN